MKAKPAKKTAAKPVRAAKPAKKPSPKAAPRSAGAPAKPAATKAGKGAAARVPAAKEAPSRASAAKPAPKSKSPMTVAMRRKEMQHFRALLLDRQRELMRAYKTSKGDSQSHLDNGTEDYIDYAVNSYAKEFLLSLTELDRKQLLLVEEALRRIDRGEFGRCQQCGEEILRKRLEVAPWARYCIRCQEMEEQGLLPAGGAFGVGDEDIAADEADEEVAGADDAESDRESDEETLDEEPLVVDGDDSEE